MELLVGIYYNESTLIMNHKVVYVVQWSNIDSLYENLMKYHYLLIRLFQVTIKKLFKIYWHCRKKTVSLWICLYIKNSWQRTLNYIRLNWIDFFYYFIHSHKIQNSILSLISSSEGFIVSLRALLDRHSSVIMLKSNFKNVTSFINDKVVL